MISQVTNTHDVRQAALRLLEASKTDEDIGTVVDWVLHTLELQERYDVQLREDGNGCITALAIGLLAVVAAVASITAVAILVWF